MNTHDWQAMVREVTQQILHSDRFSKAELQLGPLSQEQAEIPNRPGILGDQGVIPTGVERNDIARRYPSFERIGKWESTPTCFQGEEYRDHPIHLVTPRVEACINHPARWCRWNAHSIGFLPP